MSRVVIVARTRMRGDDRCIGGHDLDHGFRGVRLLDRFGGHPTRESPLPSHAFLRSHGRSEVLFIGTLADDSSSAERWPLVKALDQFGTLNGASATTSIKCYNLSKLPGGTEISCQYVNTTPDTPDPGSPTYDLSRVRYTSKYISFVSKDLIDRGQHVYQNLSSAEQSLFDRYVRVAGFPNWHDAVWQTIVSNTASTLQPGHMFPLLAVGGYISTGAHVAIAGDLMLTSGRHLPFSTIQQSLRRARPVGATGAAPPYSLINDFNAETNVITAFICHADGLRPARVCGRPVIRTILKRIR